MSRGKILCWAFAAFCTIIAGVNMAYEANIKMTGNNNIMRPFAYRVANNAVDIAFLGKTYNVLIPRDKLKEIREQVKSTTIETVRWVETEIKKIHASSMDKARSIKGDLADI